MTKIKIKKHKLKHAITATVLPSIQRIIKVKAFVPVARTINGSLTQGNMSYLMKLTPLPYTYTSGKQQKTTSTSAYRIKGLRGGVRHAVMKVCVEAGLEVCHSSSKVEDKHGNSLLPAGFHAQASCIEQEKEQECIVHQIFGSIRHTSIMAVDSPPVVNPRHETAKFSVPVQHLYIGVENCTVMSYDGKPIQNFKHHYVSGELQFELDVTSCQPQQLGLLLEAITQLEKIGGGYNIGYGHISRLKFSVVIRTITKKRSWEDDGFVITHDIVDESLQQELYEALTAWQHYLSKQTKLPTAINVNPEVTTASEV